MNISSFKLINGGYSGVTVKAVEPVAQGNMTVLDNVNRERPYPLPDDLRNKIQDMKYFFLNLTGHWIEPFNRYFDGAEYKVIPQPEGVEPPKGYFIMQNILNHTKVTGVTIKNSGFCMMGEIETVEGKKMGVTTPFVNETDDVAFFIEAMDRIAVIMDDLSGVIRSNKALPFNATEVVKSIGIKSEDASQMTEQEMIDMVIENLQDRGAIIMMSSDGNNMLSEGDKTTLYASTGSIDSHNIQEAGNHEEEDEKIAIVPENSEIDNQNLEDSDSAEMNEDEDAMSDQELFERGTSIIPETVVKEKGTLVSEKNFPNIDGGPIADNSVPAGGSLEDYEYSQNLGIPEGPGIENFEQPEDKW